MALARMRGWLWLAIAGVAASLGWGLLAGAMKMRIQRRRNCCSSSDWQGFMSAVGGRRRGRLAGPGRPILSRSRRSPASLPFHSFIRQ
jgi:hypothetical protein